MRPPPAVQRVVPVHRPQHAARQPAMLLVYAARVGALVWIGAAVWFATKHRWFAAASFGCTVVGYTFARLEERFT